MPCPALHRIALPVVSEWCQKFVHYTSPVPLRSTGKQLGDLGYRSQELEEALAELGIMLLTNEASARRPGIRQQIEIDFPSLKRIFGLGETLATTLVGLATRITAKMTAYTYAFLINRMMGRPQGRIKELWA